MAMPLPAYDPNIFPGIRNFATTTRDDWHRDRTTMKTPVVLVTATLTVAILLAASLLIVTGTRGEDAPWPLGAHPARSAVPPPRKESDRRPADIPA